MPTKSSPTIINNRAFYTTTITLILIQASILQFEIASKAVMGLFLIGFALLFFSSLNKPDIAILGAVIYIPFSKFFVGNIGTGLNFTNSFLIIILFGWFISHEYRDEKFLIATPLNFSLILFTLFGLVALIQGGYILSELEGGSIIFSFWRWFTPMLFFFLTVNNVEDKDTIKKIITLVMITVFVVSLMTIKSYIDLGEFASWDKARIGGISDQPNALGAFLVYYAPLLLGIFATSDSFFKYYFLFIPMATCARAVHVTFSRGAWLAYGIAHLFVVAFSKSKKMVFMGLLIIIIFATNPSMIPESVRSRFEMTFQKKQTIVEMPAEEKLERSASDRLIIWGGAWRIIKTHPMLGIGYGTFPYFIRDYSEIEGRRDPHNTYLKIGSEMGIPALITFISMIIIIFINTAWVFRHAKSNFFRGAALGFMGSTIGLIVSCMFGSRMDSLETIGQYWILAGVMMRLKIILQQEELQEYGERV